MYRLASTPSSKDKDGCTPKSGPRDGFKKNSVKEDRGGGGIEAGNVKMAHLSWLINLICRSERCACAD